MNNEQFRESKSVNVSEKIALSELEKNKKINNLIDEYADLGAINLTTVPTDEYDSFKDEFLAKFEGTDDELEDAIRSMHEQPVYSEDGTEIAAYQVYTYPDTSHFSEEQLMELEGINEKMREVTSDF